MLDTAKSSDCLPATVLSGFLGAEKTSLLNHVLNNCVGGRLVVIFSDMSGVNIDAALVRDGGANLPRTDERLLEMTNGCICRTPSAAIRATRCATSAIKDCGPA